jgi:sugar phosphate isomerase/epimerase
MQLGIFAKTFAGDDPLTVLRAAATNGFSTVQYNMACSGLGAMPDVIADDVVAAVAAASKETGVSLSALSGTYNMVHPDVRVREQGHRRLRVLASQCQSMGTGLITLCTGTRDADDQWRAHPDNQSPEAWRDLCAAMEVAIGIADAFDIDLGIEPELANVVNSAALAHRLMDELQSPRLKIVFDPANLFEHESLDQQRAIVSAALDLLADRIVLAHAKDRDVSGVFATAGTGCLDYGHYIAGLRRVGFDGALITHGLSAAEAPGVSKFLKGFLND